VTEIPHPPPEGPHAPNALDGSVMPVPAPRRLIRADRRAPPGNQAASSITLGRVLDAVRYWWKLAVPLGLLSALVGVAVVYLTFIPQYEAAALIRIEQRAPFIAWDIKGDAQSNAFVQTQVELLRHAIVLGPVIADPQVSGIREIAREEDKVRWLSKKITVKALGQSELFTVSFACSDPEGSARVVNSALDNYFKLHEEQEVTRIKKVMEILQEEKNARSSEVKRLRNELREKAKQLTGRDPFVSGADSGPAPPSPQADLKSRLIVAQVEEEVLAAQIKAIESLAAKSRSQISEAMLDRAVAENPGVQAANNRLLDRKARLQQLESLSAMGKDDPGYRRQADELARDEQALTATSLEVRRRVKEQLQTVIEGRRDEELSKLRYQLENRRMTTQLLKEQYKNELGSAKQSSGDSVEVRFTQDELARAEEIYKLISGRALQLQTEQSAPPRVSLLERAKEPTAPLEKLPYKWMILATLAGLGLPFGLALVKEQMTRRVTDSEYLEQQTHLTVIGEITRLPSRTSDLRGRVGVSGQRAIRLFEESMDSLRTHLFLSPELQSARVLAVTSAVDHEGKTSVAAQLAVSIARATHEPTLLIDGDLRSPSVNKVFDLPLEPGLAEVLGGECGFEAAVRTTWVDGLHVISAGKLAGNPHRLFGNGAVKSLLERVPGNYRYVILDTPPVLAAAEAMVLATAADAFLMCAMRDVSRMSQFEKAAERLVSAGGRMAGTVLSGVPTTHYVRRYGEYAGSSHE
jgi:capsular exopolysaccharide synthesis family protein